MVNGKEKKEFYRQLEAFSEDNSYFSLYDDAVIQSDKILVRLFRYEIQEKKKSNILIPTEDGGVTTNFESLGRHITNIGIVIKVGTMPVKPDAYESGDIVVFTKKDIIGNAPNPDFLYLHQFSRMGGDAEPIVPKWMKEQIPAIQAHWLDHQFVLPHEYDMATQNILTYAIPEYKIIYKWEL